MRDVEFVAISVSLLKEIIIVILIWFYVFWFHSWFHSKYLFFFLPGVLTNFRQLWLEYVLKNAILVGLRLKER